ncbi:hypothetical protein [Streptomyces phaeochromogenes]|uniref:hypothetical protein n=1 Tax=Streptomyces phaeochromogenes TaxID=1923 RepID=UPI0039A01C07
MRRAVVIGGGLSSMLATATAAPFADEVTVVERDDLPRGPEPRKGLPQANHAHVLWSGGAKAIESNAYRTASGQELPSNFFTVSYPALDPAWNFSFEDHNRIAA